MLNKKWFIYILECEDNSLYTGYSSNAKKRFLTHCSGKGAKYTKSHKPRKILYIEKHNTKIEAMKKERQIKEWPRKKKLNFIEKKSKFAAA
ncbi:MAG: putative endonuclease [Parcubacteria group bacterium GW2011_GWF2_39_13b]|nr:MAG: putative endonuclease [Parcubacteria group bacterium GW2011_GWF2_39_13b]